MMNNFAWAAKTLFWISGAPQAHFGSFKGLYQRGYYCREHLCSQTSLKAWDSEEKQVFLSRLPLSCHIAQLATYPIDPGILISLYTSAHHPYTTLATGEWMIFWPGEDTGVEVRPTECIRHLVHVLVSDCCYWLATKCALCNLTHWQVAHFGAIWLAGGHVICVLLPMQKCSLSFFFICSKPSKRMASCYGHQHYT